MDLHFEGFAAGLVDVRGLHYGEGAALGRQRDRAGNFGAGPDGGVDDLACTLVDHAVVVGLQPDADGKAFVFLGFCHFVLSPL